MTLLFSCASKKQIEKTRVAYQVLQKGLDSTIEKVLPFEDRTVRLNEKLLIQLSTESLNTQQLEPYGGQRVNEYVVNPQGDIFFPVVGYVRVLGLTRNQVQNLIKDKLTPYLRDAIVFVRFENFKVRMLGEFTREGIVELSDNNADIISAILLVGGVNQFGRRDSLLVIREDGNQRKVYSVDLRDATTVFNSNAYQLRPNDIVFAQGSEMTYRTVRNNTVAAKLAQIIPITTGLTILALTIQLVSFIIR